MKKPIAFEANQGQTDEQVNFLARGSGYTLFLTPSEAVLTLRQTTTTAPGQAEDKSTEAITGSVLHMKLVGANPKPQVRGLEELAGRVNYFIGNDPTKWRTDIPTYTQVKYQDAYPGVDLVYYGNQRQLEYDFVVAPGADPAAIALGVEGAEALDVDSQGDLVVQVAGSELRMGKPVVYQEVAGVRQEIAGGYVLHGPQQVGFHLGAYDHARPVIIDPVLLYSTYLGGSGNDEGSDIAVDSDGNAYATGSTESNDFPTTAGAFDTTFNGGTFDAFLTKVSDEDEDD